MNASPCGRWTWSVWDDFEDSSLSPRFTSRQRLTRWLRSTRLAWLSISRYRRAEILMSVAAKGKWFFRGRTGCEGLVSGYGLFLRAASFPAARGHVTMRKESVPSYSFAQCRVMRGLSHKQPLSNPLPPLKKTQTSLDAIEMAMPYGVEDSHRSFPEHSCGSP